MKCAILQPSYIPWRGYFDQIRKADTFVFYDDVQYDKQGWRNRNRIKTANGTIWLTIPVNASGSVERKRPINEIAISPDRPWNQKHLGTLKQSYARAPHFSRYEPLLERLLADPPPLLADFTISTTIELARELGLDREFVRSSELGVTGARTDRLLAVMKEVGATHYISGPSARAYLEEDKLAEAGITLEYMEYDYPEYAQLHPPYDPQVSIVDLLMMEGPNAAELLG